MLNQTKKPGKLLSRNEMKSIAGGRVVCHNIIPGQGCNTVSCWLQSPTRCCCAET